MKADKKSGIVINSSADASANTKINTTLESGLSSVGK